jgi:hypothetical protein
MTRDLPKRCRIIFSSELVSGNREISLNFFSILLAGYESSSNKFLSCDISPMDALLCAGTELDEKSNDALIVFW